MKHAIVMLAASLAFAPATAVATCFMGGSPTYGDVERLEVSDCPPANPAGFCYAAELYFVGDVVYGKLIGANGAPLLGTSELSSNNGNSAGYARLVALLKSAQFFDRTVATRKHVVPLLDGRNVRILAERCSTTVITDVPSEEFSDKTRSDVRWKRLADGLRDAILAFHWHQVLVASPAIDYQRIMSAASARPLPP